MSDRTSRRPWGWIGAAAVLSLAVSPLGAQSYGGHNQVLVIGAGAFGPESGDIDYLDSDGYVRNAVFESGSIERASLILPEGAALSQICLYSDDRGVSSYGTSMSLVAAKLVPAGDGGPQTLTIPGSTLQTTPGAGFASYCTGPLGFTVRSSIDIDGDGVPDAAAYSLNVTLALGGRIGGATVTWSRQVSPAPANPTFADVPATDGAFQFIEALSASAITAGCGGGNYCPGAFLTRGQMAVFLAKALGLHWPN